MKVVAILQNQWFKQPERVKEFLSRMPQCRESYLAKTLFMGCKTGRVLMDVFDEDWVNSIVWEEASPEIGNHSSSVFPADIAHVKGVMDKHQPQVVLAFGKVAQEAVAGAWSGKVIKAPHPCARGSDTLAQIQRARTELDLLAQTTTEDWV
jgi:hypothetical protein